MHCKHTCAASTTAGIRFATAVPELTTTAAQRPLARANPNAMKPAPRSSFESVCAQPAFTTAVVIGAHRDPGHSTTCANPERRSSSRKRAECTALRFGNRSSQDGDGDGELRWRGNNDTKFFIFMCTSSHSLVAVEPRTIPAPANIDAWHAKQKSRHACSAIRRRVRTRASTPLNRTL